MLDEQAVRGAPRPRVTLLLPKFPTSISIVSPQTPGATTQLEVAPDGRMSSIEPVRSVIGSAGLGSVEPGGSHSTFEHPFVAASSVQDPGNSMYAKRTLPGVMSQRTSTMGPVASKCA